MGYSPWACKKSNTTEYACMLMLRGLVARTHTEHIVSVKLSFSELHHFNLSSVKQNELLLSPETSIGPGLFI